MKVITPGHVYELATVKPHHGPGDPSTLVFVCNEPGWAHHDGTQNQEVLRALIDRMKTIDKHTPWPKNKEIIKHLRYALALHEARHIERLVDKDLPVEDLPIDPSTGHLVGTDLTPRSDCG